MKRGFALGLAAVWVLAGAPEKAKFGDALIDGVVNVC